MPPFPLPFASPPDTLNVAGVTQLAPSVEPAFISLVWSPDSTRLAVTYAEPSSADYPVPLEDSTMQIQILTIGSQGIKTIDESNPGIRDVLAWLPDDKIAFYANNDLKEGTWLIPADGSGAKEMIVEGLRGFLSANGRQVAYWELDWDSQPDRLSMYVRDLESGEQREVFQYKENYVSEGDLAWSPDGSRILFTFGASPIAYDQVFQSTDIYSLDVASKDVKRLTNDGFYHSIAWSPDQKLIIYAHREKNGKYNQDALYLMKSDGSCPVQIIEPGDYDFISISWSPNGRWIAFIWAGGVYLLDTVEMLGKDLVKYYSACP